MAFITFEDVGALLRGEVRRFLNELKFKEDIEEFREQKRLLTSDFIVKGEQKKLEALERTYYKWGKENNLFQS